MKQVFIMATMSFLLLSCDANKSKSQKPAIEELDRNMSTWDNERIALRVFAKGNQKTNKALIYVKPYVIGKKLLHALKIDEQNKFMLVINESQEHQLKPLNMPKRYNAFTYGFEMPLDEARNAKFRLDVIRSKHQSVTGAAYFRLPEKLIFNVDNIQNNKRTIVDDELVKINFTLNYRNNRGTFIGYEIYNHTCTLLDNNQKIKTYVDNDPSGLKINWLPAKSELLDTKKSHITASFANYYGKQLFALMTKTAKLNKVSLSSAVKMNCKGEVILKLKGFLMDYIYQKELSGDYGLRGEKAFGSLAIFIENFDNFAFDFTYKKAN